MTDQRAQNYHMWDDPLEQRGRDAVLRSQELIAKAKELIAQAKKLKGELQALRWNSD